MSERTDPKPGSQWVHRNGQHYTVLFITNTAHESAEHEQQVVYIGRNGNVWSRPRSSWYDRMIPT